MWENLSEVAWDRLGHAYGDASDVPDILRRMISFDEPTRENGWGAFWGAVNHQEDYYDSTVAAIPFLIEAAGRPDVPERERILDYFRQRWEVAAAYDGDPNLDDPPGGIDVPTPFRSDAPAEPAEKACGMTAADTAGPANAEGDADTDGDADADDDADTEGDADADDGAEEAPAYRRMDLCAWQVGRAILRGLPTYRDLLHDPDRKVAGAAALLLLTWRETRAEGERVLLRQLDDETDPHEAARRILELGVYGSAADAPRYRDRIAPCHAAVVRAAAALAWAWAIDPAPLPAEVAEAIEATSVPACDAFGKLPRVGVYRGGPWNLPANLADLPLRLAENHDAELRFRSVQALEFRRASKGELSPAVVVPLLLRCLTDESVWVRETAALSLARVGPAVAAHAPDALPALVRALDDSSPTVCGQMGRLLAMLSDRLSPTLRAEALDAVGRAARRFVGHMDFVRFGTSSTEASPYLQDLLGPLAEPIRWEVPQWLEELDRPDRQDYRLPPAESERGLADAYRQDPAGTLDLVIGALDAENRRAALGAAEWLLTLGPAAAAALPALEAAANGSLDEYARERIRTAADRLRRLLRVPSGRPESAPAGVPGHPPSEYAEDDSAGESAGTSVRPTATAPRFAARDASASPLDPLWAERLARLSHPDPAIRAETAERLAFEPLPAELRSEFVARLEGLFADDAFVEVGISGEFLHAGRLHHWRMERRGPRAAAIRARLALEPPPVGDSLLRAMLAAVRQPSLLCGRHAVPPRFSPDQWSAAASAAGGFAIAERLARAAFQEHLALFPNSALLSPDLADLAPPDASDLVPIDGLKDIVRHFSGRLA